MLFVYRIFKPKFVFTVHVNIPIWTAGDFAEKTAACMFGTASEAVLRNSLGINLWWVNTD